MIGQQSTFGGEVFSTHQDSSPLRKKKKREDDVQEVTRVIQEAPEGPKAVNKVKNPVEETPPFPSQRKRDSKEEKKENDRRNQSERLRMWFTSGRMSRKEKDFEPSQAPP